MALPHLDVINSNRLVAVVPETSVLPLPSENVHIRLTTPMTFP